MFPFPEPSFVLIYIQRLRKAFCSLELRVQFCLLVCCTYPSFATVNKGKNRTDQRASLRVDTRERQCRCFRFDDFSSHDSLVKNRSVETVYYVRFHIYTEATHGFLFIGIESSVLFVGLLYISFICDC